jgi:alkylated DNA repair protein (DNA oxidative demethylase)
MGGEITAESTVVGQLDEDEQRSLVAQVQTVVQHAPWVRPHTPGGQPLRVMVSAAGERGWWSDKRGYRYIPRHPAGHAWPPMPGAWLELWARFSTRPDLCPDSAAINWYRADAALGWHADVSEQDVTLPIVTISLGDPATWAVREREGATETRCRLHTGAVTLLAGAARSYEHTIERILRPVEPPPLQVGLGIEAEPASAPFFVPMVSPLPGGKRGRISITMRVAGSSRAAASAIAPQQQPQPAAVPYEQALGFLAELEARMGRRSA